MHASSMAGAYAPAARPDIAPPGPWQFPAPTRLDILNGPLVLLHHLPGQHIATIACHTRAWADDEPADLAGITGIMIAAMTSAEHLTDRLSRIAMTLTYDLSYTGPVITGHLPAQHLPAGLALLAEVLAEPAFEPSEVTRQAQRVAASIAAAEASPAARLQRLLPAAIYGDGTAAGRPLGGTPQTLARITADHVRAWHDAYVRPATTTVVIAGDLTGVNAAEAAAEVLGRWRDPRPGRPGSVVTPLRRRGPAAILAGFPGGEQVNLLVAAPVPGRGHTAWPALSVAAHILGGPVTGQLNARLREKAGATYGMHAMLTEPVPGSGVLMISGAVASGKAIPALADVLAVTGAAIREGFTAAETTAAVEAMTRQTPLFYETAPAIAAITMSLAINGLPSDFPDMTLASIAGLTPARLATMMQSYLSQGRLTVLVAGDPGELAGPMAELVGPIPLSVL